MAVTLHFKTLMPNSQCYHASTFVGVKLMKLKISKFFYPKTDIFELWFLYKRCAGEIYRSINIVEQSRTRRYYPLYCLNYVNCPFKSHNCIYCNQVCRPSGDSNCRQVTDRVCNLVQDVVCRNITENR